MKETVSITSKEYQNRYVPGPGFVLIKRDVLPDKVGSLFVPRNSKDLAARMSSTGTIVAVSNIKPNDDHDAYLSSVYRVGDRVGFSSTTPIMSPAPPYYEIKNEDGSKDNSVIIHVADIIGILFEDEASKVEFLGRVDERNKVD